MQRYLASMMILLSTACVQHQQPLSIDTPSQQAPSNLFADKGRFGKSPRMHSEAELFELSEFQKREFLDYMQDPELAHKPKYKRLYDYLEESTYNFNYRGKTYLAQDAIDFKQGNCLSLAIMTTALARVADVNVAYQLIDTTPVFELGDNAVAKGVHVRSKLYHTVKQPANDSQPGSFSRTGIVVDYFPSKTKRFLGNISEQNFIARYYRNLAVEYLQNTDYNNSYWHALKALDYAPHDHEGLNLMAVIFKHAGFYDQAEQIYKYGVAVADNKLSLLKNYRQLLNEQGRNIEALALNSQLAEIEDPSPYNWLQLADDLYTDGSYKEASGYYKKAVKLAPYLPYGYLGLAKVHYSQGSYHRSKTMLEKAIENNHNHDDDQLYRAKLAALTSVKNSDR